MNYEINIITRKQVPSDIYLCGENDKQDFRYIHLFEFENGLKYVIGSYNYINTVEEIIENLEFDFRTANEYNNNPDELQEYYKNEFDIYYKYSICNKIWNYYNNNKQLIKEVIEYYKTDDENTDDTEYEFETDEEIEDEGIIDN
jgi:hypothetical protein